MTAALHGWHPGEVAVQQKLGYADAVRQAWGGVENAMREQHRVFHTSDLPFIPVTTVDGSERPWAAVVAGAGGDTGFVESPDANSLTVAARLWDGDPLLDTVRAWLDTGRRRTGPRERFLTAGLGIEFPTRRRNKFAGAIRGVKRRMDLDYELDVEVTEALGNCPKYINTRTLVPHPDTHPSIAHRNLHIGPDDRLPGELVDVITAAKTVFVATVYGAAGRTAERHPSHAGMNARSGLPGFVRVSPSDGRTVVVPEYSGNRFVSSLGNIEASGLAALTVVCFASGDVLYLTGATEVLVGKPARDTMPRQGCVVRVETSGYVFVRDALPVRQQPGTGVGRSPYSPRVKYLGDEPEAAAGSSAAGRRARLVGAVPWARDVATFRFRVDGADGLRIRPGQAVVLDFMDWIGPPRYAHMAEAAPGSINDDRVRTWTVSSAHGDGEAAWFELTMREMTGGVVTGALFRVLREHAGDRRGEPVSIKAPVAAHVVGIAGDFCLGRPGVKMLFVAGGIGVTPFLAMLKALAERGEGDVLLALAMREPDVMLRLLDASLPGDTESGAPGVKLRVDLFASRDGAGAGPGHGKYTVALQRGRIRPEYWAGVASEDRDVFICGPDGFGNAAMAGLRAAGVASSRISREGFY